MDCDVLDGGVARLIRGSWTSIGLVVGLGGE